MSQQLSCFAMRLFYNDQVSLDLTRADIRNKDLSEEEVDDWRRRLHQTECKIFKGRKIRRTPVLRFFGQTKRGQKACVNIFDYFPYFFVELPPIVFDPSQNGGNAEEFLVYFAQCLEAALQVVTKSMREASFESLPTIQDELFSQNI